MQGERQTVVGSWLVSLIHPPRTVTSGLPASALDEPESDDEEEVTGVEGDDERSGTKYNVSLRVCLERPQGAKLTDVTPTVLVVPCHFHHCRDVCGGLAH